MRPVNCALVFVAMALVNGGCASLDRKATEEPRPLSYVGRIDFGEPREVDGDIVVPVTYSGGEWHMNSGLVPSSVDAHVLGDTIELTVLVSLAPGASENGYRLVLPGDTRGTFALYYRDPDGTRGEIGTLEISDP